MLKNLINNIPIDLFSSHIFRESDLYITTSREKLIDLIRFFKDSAYFNMQILTDICGADYPEREKRFDVVYNLLSVHFNYRIIIKIEVDEAEFVPSLTSIYQAAGWLEREVWDMYGIVFEGNDDLRRILTDYGFEGHPLRKDFPLTGYTEVRYDMEKKKVVYEPVNLQQEFRKFDFLSPWEGPDYVLPGDEKASKG